VSSIRRLGVEPIVVPLPRAWGPDVTSITVLAVTVEDSDGALGHGFSWTPSIGAASVRAMLEHDIAAWALGRPADAAEIWQPLWRHLHEGGSGGITTIAMAGLDLALWDLAARRAGVSIAELRGIRRPSVPAYGSGINLHYSLDELCEQAERWVAAGFGAVKVKVGSPHVGRDVERLRAVREIIGDRTLMIDANQRWDLDQAAAALTRLEQFDPAWIEEPLRADDLDGHRALATRTGIPIACGENLYTRYRFGEFARSGAIGTLQPNLVRIGGITPLDAIVADAAESGVAIALHLLPELSGQLALTLPDETPAEIIDGALFAELGALAEPAPIRLRSGRVSARDHLGLGIRFTTPSRKDVLA
jgi:L-alanine-DL-glutamate epimerase-like enolase superfamily enzyme